tara:strand:- start:652 stop:858 length:207 start_codon:yes stop_codon:yes gene_type:complete
MSEAQAPTREELIEQLTQEQNNRLNHLANNDPVINRIAGKLEVLRAMADPPTLTVEPDIEDEANGTLG